MTSEQERFFAMGYPRVHGVHNDVTYDTRGSDPLGRSGTSVLWHNRKTGFFLTTVALEKHRVVCKLAPATKEKAIQWFRHPNTTKFVRDDYTTAHIFAPFRMTAGLVVQKADGSVDG